VISVLAAGALGCAGNWGEAPLETPEPEARALVTIRARDAELTLTSTVHGIRYSVRDAQGALQAALTLEQLQALDPGLHELARRATAGGGEAGLDASLFGMQALEPPTPGAALDASRGAPHRVLMRVPRR
jgi:hypothetical protein